MIVLSIISFRFTESQTEACQRRSGRIIGRKIKIEGIQRVLGLHPEWSIWCISWSNMYSIRTTSTSTFLDFAMFALRWQKKYLEFFFSNVIIFLVLFKWNLLSKVSPNTQTIQFEFQFARKAVMWRWCRCVVETIQTTQFFQW